MSKSGGNLTTQYNLRWSDDLKEKIAQSAKEHNRSMNADIVARLEESFEPEVKVTETLEFELMMQSYLDQAKQIKELKEMLEQVLKKPS